MILSEVFNILGPIVIITLIGYFLGRSSLGLHSQTLSTIVILVATPALIFNTLTSLHVNPLTIGTMATAALVCLAIAGLLALLAIWVFGGSLRSFLPGLMLPNSGNMGLPLVALAFGDEGMRLGISYFFVVALFQHSVGLSITAGSIRLKSLAQQPLIYSVILVLIVTFLDLPVPQLILTTTEMLGNMMIPAMLILLGSSLASLQVTDFRPALAMAVGRLVIGLISAVAVIYLLDLSGIVAGSVFLLATMPTAIVTYVFAERYQQNPQQVAGGVVLSTVLTFCCLPALIWAALRISELDLGGMGSALK
ncbi:MAG: AEC family transporter [Hoeflea sp.]|uniref:AEC family transporter n=1 Tax=Hoeflea sp. TaxID=1940281 RepID=UPI003EF73232